MHLSVYLNINNFIRIFGDSLIDSPRQSEINEGLAIEGPGISYKLMSILLWKDSKIPSRTERAGRVAPWSVERK